MALIFSIANTVVTPGADITSDWGSTSLRWLNGFMGGTLTLGTVSATGNLISAGTVSAVRLTIGTVSATGNLISAGTGSFGGAIIGGTILTIGTVSATGNVICGGISSVAGALIVGGTSTLGAFLITDSKNITLGTGTGTTIGTTTNQKLSFYGVTPIVQQANTVALDTLVTSFGFRASGGVALFDTDVKANIAGKGYYIKEGANATMGTVALVAGTANVATNKVTANSRVLLTPQAAGTGNGSVSVNSRTAGTSFAVESTNILDDRQIAWLIFEPA